MVTQPHLFRAQFEKDLEFFKLLLLLVNKSRIIRHMSVLWAENGPAAQVGLSQVLGTEHAMETPCFQNFKCDPKLDPDFCQIINDYGHKEARSCGLSDRAAEGRCRETGKAQVYACYAGLSDIAVPVVSDGQYIGTLLCGQVLREPPSEEGFQRVRKNVERLDYIDLELLKAEYWKVPVSSDAEIQNIVELLETFADYLATSWGRLTELVREQHRSIRESQLLRKEFAHLVLDGPPADPSSFRELITKLGFTKTPNRVLVVNLEPDVPNSASMASFEVRFTAAIQAIEELCDGYDNMAVAYLRKRGVSVFFHDSGSRAPNSVTDQVRGLARRILDEVRVRCGLGARIGIGGGKADARLLVQSYDEACSALAQSPDQIAVYHKSAEPIEDVTAAAERICGHLSARRLGDARAAVDAVCVLASQRLGHGPSSLDAQRQFFCSTLYSMCFCAKQLGADHEVLDQVQWKVDSDIHGAGTLLEVQGSYRQLADNIIGEVRKLYSSRQDKLVERASRLIDREIEQGNSTFCTTSSQVAQSLMVSVSHLGRTFKHITGVTFERFVMKRRVDFAKQLLLNPDYNVSQVAEKCGFSDPAYFSRAFRRLAGCPPSAYMQNPLHYEHPQDSSSAGTSGLTLQFSVSADRRTKAS